MKELCRSRDVYKRQRYLYPEDEITKNKSEYQNGLKLLGGEDKITTRVWWDIK